MGHHRNHDQNERDDADMVTRSDTTPRCRLWMTCAGLHECPGRGEARGTCMVSGGTGPVKENTHAARRRCEQARGAWSWRYIDVATSWARPIDWPFPALRFLSRSRLSSLAVRLQELLHGGLHLELL